MAQKVAEAQLNLTDVTTANVSSTAHGFAPKSPASATQFLNGAATPAWAQVKDSDLSVSDVTTNNVSTTAHGFVPKAPNDTTKFLRGDATWAVPAGGSGAWTQISVLSGSGASGLFDFTSIAGTYNHLKVIVLGRSDAAATADNLYVRLNGDTTAANYEYGNIRGTNSVASSAQTQSDTNGVWFGSVPAATATANYAGICEILIPVYAGTTFYKEILGTLYMQSASSSAGTNKFESGGTWKSTSAVTQVTVHTSTGNWITGSKAILYGIT